MVPANDPNRTRARRFLSTFFLLAFLWWILSDGDISSWKIGFPAVMTATLLAVLQHNRTIWQVRPWGALRFATFFLYQSARGGIDVARRAVTPSLPLAPDLIEFTTRLPRGPARTFFVSIIGLLPGTLTVRISGYRLMVHVLDTRLPITQSLEQLEERIARLFGLELSVDKQS
jgi:multicomponent Na+:H+ antiporter subunit E